MLDAIPAHCIDAAADLVRGFASTWRIFAEELEQIKKNAKANETDSASCS